MPNICKKIECLTRNRAWDELKFEEYTEVILDLMKLIIVHKLIWTLILIKKKLKSGGQI